MTEFQKGILMGALIVVYCYIFFSAPRVLKVSFFVPASEGLQDAPIIQ